MRPDRIIVGEVRQAECLDLLMVPLVYLLTTVFQVQRAAVGVTEAARQAGRAYVRADSQAEAASAARAAAELALTDQGVALGDGLDIAAAEGLIPGATVRVTVSYDVPLPVLGLLFGQHEPPIPVRATAVQEVDRFREAPAELPP